MEGERGAAPDLSRSKAVVREIERIRSGPALRLLDELLTLLDSAKVLPSDIAQGTQDDVPTEDEALAAATERMRMAFSSPALEGAFCVVSRAGA